MIIQEVSTNIDTSEYFCVLCEKSILDVKSLITNHSNSVCDSCILRCYKLIQQKTKEDGNGTDENEKAQ